MKSLFLFLLLALPNLLVAQTGPGGVKKNDGTTSLVLWLRASDLALSDAASVSTWTDQSGHGNSASAAGVRQPTFYSTTHSINSLPVVRFDGDLSSGGANGDRLDISDDDTIDETDELTYFVVLRPTTLDGSPRGFISKRTNSSSDQAYSSFFYTSNYLNTDISTNSRITSSPTAYTTSTSYIVATDFSNPTTTVYSNGTAVSTNGGHTTTIGNESSQLSLGQLQGNTSGYYAGDIAEVIIFNDGISSAERIVVENYLANRYAISISTDRYAFEGSYGNDIAGIGKESDGSQAMNTSDRIRIYEDTFDNGSYVFWGHDNAAATLTEVADLPLGNNARLERVWRVDYTGTNATTTVKISKAGLTLGAGETFRLLVDDDGTFASGASQYAGTLDGDTLVVPNVIFSSDSYITLGKVTAAASATYYAYQDGDWETAASWTTDPSGFTQVPVGGQVPGASSTVNILNGRTITIPGTDVSAKTITSTTIEGGGTLDLTTTTGHDFGILSGEGTLRLEGFTLPSGTFTSFISSSGGTIEYYNTTGTLPTGQATYNNLSITNDDTGTETVTLASDITLNGNLLVEDSGSGSLSFTIGNNTTSRTLVINGNTTITDATFTVGTSNATHTIDFYGDLTNTGIFDMVNGSGEANTYFKGSTNNIATHNGTLNEYYYIEVNKGTDQTFIQEFTAGSGSNFSVSTSSGDKIAIKTGTCKLSSSNISITNISNGAVYEISSDNDVNGQLWLNGATIDNSSAFAVYGKLRVSSGTLNVANQGMVIREDGEISIEGGTVTVEKYRISTVGGSNRGTLSITGGTLNIDNTLSGSSNTGYAALSIPYSTQFFTMSGGTVNVKYAEASGTAIEGGIQINCDPSNINVTGGTWNIYIPTGSTTDFRIASTAPFYDLNIYKNGTGTSKAILQDINSSVGNVAAQTLQVLNDFTITSTGSPTFDANGNDVQVGHDFTLSSGATYTNTGSANTFSMTHDILSLAGTSMTVTLNNSISFESFTVVSDNSIDFAGSNDPTITGNLTHTSGNFDASGKTITVQGNVINNSDFIGTGGLLLQGASLQTISGSGSFTNITVDNANNVSMTGDQQINGDLRINDGLLQITDNLLTLSDATNIYDASSGTGTSFSSSKMITTNGAVTNSGITKNYTSSGGSFTFPIGTGTEYTPITVNITDADGDPGSINIKPVSSEHPNVSVSSVSLDYYWKISKSDFGTTPVATISATYDNSDINGTETDYTYGLFNNGSASWTSGASSDVDDGNNIIGGSGTALETTSSFIGDLTAGETSAFGAVTVYYSRADGDWNTASTWSNISHTGAAAATSPGASDFVVIGDGSSNNHDVFVTDASSASAQVLKISSGSSLDLRASTGNTFTTVEAGGGTGYGTLRINSSNFPSGDWSLFTATNGGTVEYYADASGNITIPSSQTMYNNIQFQNDDGSARVITLPAADLTINGNFVVGTSSNAASLTVQSENTGARNLSITGNLSIEGVSGANTTTFQLRDGSINAISLAGNLSTTTNATFEAENAGSTAHTLSIQGNITNSGSLSFAPGTSSINTTFTGSSNQDITGTGSTYSFNNITVNKGSSTTPILNFNASNSDINGSTTLTNGTLKLTSSQTITIANNANLPIPSTSRLYVDGSTVELTGTAYITLTGHLQVDSGTLNVGTTNQNNYIEYSASGSPQITINGGTVTVASQIRRPTVATSGNLIFNMSNGTLIVGDQQAPTTARGVFEILNSGSFTQSGGTIEITRAQTSAGDGTTAALLLRPSSSSVTGGIIQIGSASTPTSSTIRVNSSSTIYDLVINSVNSPTAKLITESITVSNDLTIESGATLNANALSITIGADFSNSGTYTPNSNTTIFNGSANSITGTTTFYNLTFSGSGTLTVNDNITISNNLSNNDNTISMSTNTVTLNGDLSNNGSINATTGVLLLNGASSQTISGDESGIIQRLELDNSAGAVVANNLEISSKLVLDDGVLNIGSKSLTLSNTSDTIIEDGSGGTTFTTSNMIQVNGSTSDAGVIKSIPTGASDFTFPMGVTTGYTPSRYDFASNTSAGTITVKAISSTISARTDDNSDGLDLLDFYWEVSSSGLGTISVEHYYTYLESDVQTDGATTSDADYFVGRFNSSWTSGASVGSISTASNLITVDGGAGGVTYIDGSYTAGATEEFGVLSTYYSRADGDFETNTTWSTTGHAGPAAASTPNGNPVEIDASHTVTVTANSKSTTSLVLNGTLDIGTTTGHNFGTITGTGILEIGSNVFPGGDFSSFTADGGGTVELGSGTFNLPTQTIYNNLTVSNAGTKTLPNVDITVNGDVSLSAGTLTNASFNRNMNLLGDWTNTNSTGAYVAGTGSLIFNGSAAQQIAGSFETTFYDVTLNKTGTLTLNQNATISNDLTLTAGDIDLNANTLTVTGDISNNIGTSALSNNSGTVILNGSSIQTIGGSSATTVNNITLNNSDATGVQLDQNLTINGTLTFTDGHLQTQTNFVTLGSSATISGEHSNNYVIGTLNVTRTVGTGSSSFGNIGVSIPSGSSNLGDVSIKRVSGSDGIVTVDSKQSISRRWVITNTGSNPFTARNITYSWVAADDNSKDLSEFRLFRRDTEGSGAFEGLDDYQDISTGSDTRSITVQQNEFSEITGSDSNSPLPVELIDFVASSNLTSIIVKWTTLTEYDNYGFEIIRDEIPLEQSADSSVVDVGFINGAGHSLEQKNYSFVDQTVEKAGTYRYWITQVDFDGQRERFGPIEVTYQIPDEFELLPVYPNPFNPEASVKYIVPVRSSVKVLLINSIGQLIQTLDSGSKEAGTYTVRIDGTGLSSGLYFVVLQSGGYYKTQKVTLLK